MRRRRLALTALITTVMMVVGTMVSMAAMSDEESGRNWKPPKKKNVTVKMVRLTRDGKRFELRKAARQTLYKYDTIQGACADNGYIYYTMYNRDVEKCKIVKVRIKGRKVVKVSKALKVQHGNSLTYDTRRDRLVVAHGDGGTWKISLLNPKTLKVTAVKRLKLPKKVSGMPKKVHRQFNGITAIAYNARRDVYVARLKDEHNFLILTNKFKIKRYLKVAGKSDMVCQGLDSYGDYTLEALSFNKKYRYNLIVIRNWKGKVVSRVKVPRKSGLELEEVFHDGDVFYAGFYFTTNQYHDDRRHHVKRYNFLYRLPKL